jgi:predicted acetyltransferase
LDDGRDIFEMLRGVGRPVGIGKLRRRLNAHLMAIGGHIGYAIRPSERGKGYGNLILAELLKRAWKIGIREVLITCRENNLRSRKVIEHNGGILAGISDGGCRYCSTISGVVVTAFTPSLTLPRQGGENTAHD